MSTEVTNRIFTLANMISFIRLILVPVFAVVLVAYENNILAFILFVVAASTDFLDGAIARGMGEVSRLGQQLDPLVDRILILTAVILVFLLGRVPFWILLVIIARDLSMLVLIAQMSRTGLGKLAVAFVGKAGTAFNMAGFALLILYWPIVPGLGLIEAAWLPGWGAAEAPLGIWFIYVGVILAWAAGIYYMVRAYRDYQRKNGSGPNGGTGGSGSAGRRGEGTRRSNVQNSAARQTTGRQQALGATARQPAVSATGRQQTLGARGAAANRTAAAHYDAQKNSHSKARSKTQGRASAGRGKRKQSGGQGSTLARVLNTPQRIIAALAVFLFLAIAIGFYGCDSINNFGVIHSGVKVGSIDVGGLEEAEAADLIHTGLHAVANSGEVILYADEKAAEVGANDQTVQLGHGVDAYGAQNEVDYDATSWSVTLGTIDAEVDGAKLASQAYAVGRGGDFFLGRIAANTFGVTVSPQIEFSQDRLKGVEEMLTESLGTPMKNADIIFDGSKFEAVDGQDGYVVEEKQFEQMLQTAFLSEERSLIVPMVERAMFVTLEDAKAVSTSTQAAIESPVTVSYGDASWSLTTAELGRVIATSVEEDGKDSWKLVPRVDAALLQTVLPEIIGHLEDQVAPVDAKFVNEEGVLTIVPSQNGTGVDYSRLAQDLSLVLFGEEAAEDTDDSKEEDEPSEAAATDSTVVEGVREVQVYIGELEPNFTTADAETYDFSNKISEYTIEYPYVVEGTVINIHVASDILNSTIIKPQSIWSFTGIVGECSEEKGFVPAPIILFDDYVDDIGGGLCNTATAIFNAAYEAGFPIKERINHSLRNSLYPLGRDAAIAYPWADLKFENDTDNYVLITMTYTDWTVTCTLWGVSPGYTVESVAGELVETGEIITKEKEDENLAPGQTYVEQEGRKASSVEVTRTVYYADGTVKEQWTFFSSYDATPRVIKKGPELE